MSKNLLNWKWLLILVVVGLSALAVYPPQERINLGLDLRGGLQVLMQVQTGTALKYELDLTQSRLGQEFKERGISYRSIAASGDTALEIHGTDTARSGDLREIFDKVVGQWNLQDLGSGSWRLEMPPDFRAYVEKKAIETTLSTVRTRIDALGVGEQLVQSEGVKGDRILVQLPGVEDPDRVKDIIKTSAILEWKAVTYPPGADPATWQPPESREAVLALFGGTLPEDTELYPQSGVADGRTTQIWWPLKRVSVVAGNDLRSANRSADQWNDPAVSFELSQEAGRRFEVATRENLGRKMAILLGDVEHKQVISAPQIQGVIRDQGIINGGFTIERAENLALQLRSGAMPTDVSIIEERVIGPSLGQDSVRAGLTAGLAGFLAIMLFMLVYYRLSGVNAVVALALNVLLVFGALGALPFLFQGVQATLTLPGIAGLVLTVGMAVDSNVLIFERIREELGLGKTVRSAVSQGFGRAWMTILDCHVTTLTSSFFLFSYGTGPVKGFAVTLTIGLLASLFTAVFVSRQIFEVVLGRKERIESLSI